MTNKIDLDKLEELAKNATPGPWYDDSEWSPDDVSIFQGEPRYEAPFVANVGSDHFREVGVVRNTDISNGLFIAAANPATVLALINRLRSAEEKLKAAQEQKPVAWRRPAGINLDSYVYQEKEQLSDDVTVEWSKLYAEPVPAGLPPAEIPDNRFGSNLLWFLEEFANAEDDLMGGSLEIYGEDEKGTEGSTLIGASEICEAAASVIKTLLGSLAEYAAPPLRVPDGWEKSILDAMDDGFAARRKFGSFPDESLAIDDTQVGVEFAIRHIKSLVANGVIEEGSKSSQEIPYSFGAAIGIEWSGWAVQRNGRLPKVFGSKGIAKLNCYPDEGDELIFLSSADASVALVIQAETDCGYKPYLLNFLCNSNGKSYRELRDAAVKYHSSSIKDRKIAMYSITRIPREKKA